MTMSSELEDTLKKRLDKNYTAFIDSLQKKTVPELIAIAPEITAVQQLHEELLWWRPAMTRTRNFCSGLTTR